MRGRAALDKLAEDLSLRSDVRGPERSLRMVGQEVGKSVGLIERWSSRWMWCKRALAYDAYLDDERRAGAREEALAMGRRHAQLARLMQTKVVEGLLCLDADRLPASSLARLLEVACRIERDALECPISAVPPPNPLDGPIAVRVVFTGDWLSDGMPPNGLETCLGRSQPSGTRERNPHRYSRRR
jgi:hypothetical protein